MAPEIEGFDSDSWEKSLEECDNYRKENAFRLTSQNGDPLLTKNQNEIKSLLGNPSRHRLFNRNQKFFYYNLDCNNDQVLSIRFDALGRVKEVMVEKYTE